MLKKALLAALVKAAPKLIVKALVKAGATVAPPNSPLKR